MADGRASMQASMKGYMKFKELQKKGKQRRVSVVPYTMTHKVVYHLGNMSISKCLKTIYDTVYFGLMAI